MRGWHCNSLEPPGERGSQGQSNKTKGCEAGNNFFLGHTITPNSKAISEKWIKAIRDVPRRITKKQLLSFLGMCAYCRTFIPNYAFLEKPLRALTTGKGLRSCDKIERPFTQMVDEKHGFMSSVRLQTHGDRLRPIAYFSTRLESCGSC